MSLEKDRGSEEPLMFEDHTESEVSGQWRYSEELAHAKYQKQKNFRRTLIFSLLILPPWILLALLGVTSWIRYQQREPAYLNSMLVYSKSPWTSLGDHF
jgi:hypothetical protein